MSKKDHWETQDEIAEFLKRQIERLGFPQLHEMETMTEPRVSDSVLSAAARGELDPKRTRPKTLAGIRSLEKAKGQATTKKRCPTCGGYYYEAEK